MAKVLLTPKPVELEIAHFQGEYVAKLAKKLFG